MFIQLTVHRDSFVRISRGEFWAGSFRGLFQNTGRKKEREKLWFPLRTQFACIRFWCVALCHALDVWHVGEIYVSFVLCVMLLHAHACTVLQLYYSCIS